MIQKHTTLARMFVIAMSAACACIASVDASAQTSEPSVTATEKTPSQSIRLSQSIDFKDAARGGVVVQMSRLDDGRNLPWSLHANSDDATDTRLCAAILPDHAGERYYGYDVQHHVLAKDTHLILVEATGSVEAGGPADSPTYQVAWLLQPNTRKPAGRVRWNCTLIASSHNTELDGGPKLTVDIEATPPQLLRTDSSSVVEFCGLGADSQAAVERYDLDRRRFIPHTKLEVLLKDAKPLTARLPESRFQPPFLGGIYSWAWATSDVRSTPGALVAIRPTGLGDLDTKTAWVEGAKGLGRGEYITASINELVPLRGFRIFPGNGHDPRVFSEYAQPTKILVTFSDLSRFEITLDHYDFDTLSNQGGLFVELPEPVTTNCMTVTILESRAGTIKPLKRTVDHRQSVAISEITPITTLEAKTSDETARNLIDYIANEPLVRRRDRLGNLMSQIQTESLVAIRETIAKDSPIHRTRVIPLLGQLPASYSLPVLLASLQVAQPDADEYRAIKRTIAMHGSESVDDLSQFLDNQSISDRKRVDIIRLIGRIATPVQLSLLIEELGEGSDFTRRERLRAIVNGGQTVLPALLVQASRDDTSAKASYDALRALETLGRRLYIAHGKQAEGSDLLLKATQKTSSRLHRLTAIRALGYFWHADALSYLSYDLLIKNNDPLIRRAAAQALAYYPDEHARTSLEQALSDPSPDVRIEAIISLSKHKDSFKSVPAVILYARNETWTQGLHNAYSLLANEGSPQSMDFLSQVIAKHIETDRAINAMRSLKRFDRSIDPKLIAQLLESPKTPFRARLQLVDLLGLDKSAEGEALLLSIANEEFPVSEYETDEEREQLFRQSLMAIGHRHSQAGIDTLFTIVRKEPEIERRQVALRSLGFYQDPYVANLLLAWYPKAPDALKAELQSVIGQIRNRIEIQQAVEGIDELIETLDNF